MEEYWVWCGSVIKGEDGKYHMFSSRWPKKYPFFEGYVFYSEVVRASSEKPEGPYKFEEVVLPVRGEQFWDGRMTHNPTIHKSGDTFLLYYIGSTYTGDAPGVDELKSGKAKLGRSYDNIRIGLATSRSVRGPWQRRDRPILEPRPGKWDGKVVTNPAACVRKDGSVLLVYRSNTPQGLRLGVTRATTFEGPYERISDEPILKLEGGNFVEDPFIWEVGNGFEMIAKDMTGGITGEKHAGIHALSSDGLSWTLPKEPKAYSRTVRWSDGKETTQGSLERPQLLFQDGKPAFLFAATADGPGGFRAASNTWNLVIPLLAK
ncbi:MAG: glycosyl hydrolase family 43 [Lentisphaerae bacterium RIFOXYA12_FULL_48_11]|nr:MAG: glycosyl hydrolase family 43 [Lentisphaerae bacterium RIFOXYA12_FULL_48_11]